MSKYQSKLASLRAAKLQKDSDEVAPQKTASGLAASSSSSSSSSSLDAFNPSKLPTLSINPRRPSVPLISPILTSTDEPVGAASLSRTGTSVETVSKVAQNLADMKTKIRSRSNTPSFSPGNSNFFGSEGEAESLHVEPVVLTSPAVPPMQAEVVTPADEGGAIAAMLRPRSRTMTTSTPAAGAMSPLAFPSDPSAQSPVVLQSEEPPVVVQSEEVEQSEEPPVVVQSEEVEQSEEPPVVVQAEEVEQSEEPPVVVQSEEPSDDAKSAFNSTQWLETLPFPLGPLPDDHAGTEGPLVVAADSEFISVASLSMTSSAPRSRAQSSVKRVGFGADFQSAVSLADGREGAAPTDPGIPTAAPHSSSPRQGSTSHNAPGTKRSKSRSTTVSSVVLPSSGDKSNEKSVAMLPNSPNRRPSAKSVTHRLPHKSGSDAGKSRSRLRAASKVLMTVIKETKDSKPSYEAPLSAFEKLARRSPSMHNMASVPSIAAMGLAKPLSFVDVVQQKVASSRAREEELRREKERLHAEHVELLASAVYTVPPEYMPTNAEGIVASVAPSALAVISFDSRVLHLLNMDKDAANVDCSVEKMTNDAEAASLDQGNIFSSSDRHVIDGVHAAPFNAKELQSSLVASAILSSKTAAMIEFDKMHNICSETHGDKTVAETHSHEVPIKRPTSVLRSNGRRPVTALQGALHHYKTENFACEKPVVQRAVSTSHGRPKPDFSSTTSATAFVEHSSAIDVSGHVNSDASRSRLPKAYVSTPAAASRGESDIWGNLQHLDVLPGSRMTAPKRLQLSFKDAVQLPVPDPQHLLQSVANDVASSLQEKKIKKERHHAENAQWSPEIVDVITPSSVLHPDVPRPSRRSNTSSCVGTWVPQTARPSTGADANELMQAEDRALKSLEVLMKIYPNFSTASPGDPQARSVFAETNVSLPANAVLERPFYLHPPRGTPDRPVTPLAAAGYVICPKNSPFDPLIPLPSTVATDGSFSLDAPYFGSGSRVSAKPRGIVAPPSCIFHHSPEHIPFLSQNIEGHSGKVPPSVAHISSQGTGEGSESSPGGCDSFPLLTSAAAASSPHIISLPVSSDESLGPPSPDVIHEKVNPFVSSGTSPSSDDSLQCVPPGKLPLSSADSDLFPAINYRPITAPVTTVRHSESLLYSNPEQNKSSFLQTTPGHAPSEWIPREPDYVKSKRFSSPPHRAPVHVSKVLPDRPQSQGSGRIGSRSHRPLRKQCDHGNAQRKVASRPATSGGVAGLPRSGPSSSHQGMFSGAIEHSRVVTVSLTHIIRSSNRPSTTT